MINRKNVIGAILVLLIVSLIGCAETAPSVLDKAGRESFDAWMARYDPQAEKMPSGIYIHFRERGNFGFIKPKIDTSLFELNYTAYNLSNMIITTRSEKISRLLGRWKPTTHFVDDIVPYYYTNYYGTGFVCLGLYDAFQYMRIDDSARIYIPAHLAYQVDGSASTTTQGGPLDPNAGYAGEITAYALKPLYIDLRIKGIINEPKKWEMDRVQDYVRQNWGQAARDSVAYGIYMRVLEDYPTGDVITADSTVRYFFAERFMDHKLINTNVKSVAKAANYYTYFVDNNKTFGVNTFAPTDFTQAKIDSTTNRIYADIFLKIKSGQTVEVISISRWTNNGNQGSAIAVPQILPFQPRMFQIRTLKWNEKDKETDHNLSKLL